MKNIEFNIAIRCPCNYSCHYCVGSNKKQTVELLPLKKLEKIYNSQDFFSVTSFECGSGEPSLHPQIKDLIQLFSTKGTVSIPSNNSIDPAKWLPSNAKRILIRAALHPQGEQDIDGFIDRLLKIKDIGAETHVVFVAHPERLNLIDPYMELFSSKKLKMMVSGFNGVYNGKNYPDAYTQKEKIKIGIANQNWYARLRLDITSRNFYGIPCLAGNSLIYIDTNGDIKRCLYDTKIIDTIYNSNHPCNIKHCGCGLYLEKLNTQEVSFWNYWRSIAGFPLLPTNNASDDEIYKEKKEIYLQLIKSG